MQKNKWLFLIFLVFCSCSVSVPSAPNIEAYIVFDYEQPDVRPNVFLSLFVNPLSQPARVDSISLIHDQTGQRWVVYDPILAGNGKPSDQKTSIWVGSYLIAAAPGSALPEGKYTVIYADLSDRTAAACFELSYPQKLAEADISEAVLDYGYTNMALSVFDGNGTLIYFGDIADKEWLSFADVAQDFPSAASCRISAEIPDSSAVCVLPESQYINIRDFGIMQD